MQLGRQPEKERIELINSLPLVISLLVTLDMDDFYTIGDVTEKISDYSIRIPSPCDYFLSEAKARGMRLYTMANTGGLTWDFGVIPYEPMPYQWAGRIEGMRRMKDEYGLVGVMESHYYGFYPSFISKFVKHCFADRRISYKGHLHLMLATEFGAENVEKLDKAMGIWSEAICHLCKVLPGWILRFRSACVWICIRRWIQWRRMPAIPFFWWSLISGWVGRLPAAISGMRGGSAGSCGR